MGVHLKIIQFVFLTYIAYMRVDVQCYIQYQTPEQCKTGPTDNTHEYFDISHLQCTECAQNTDYQGVTSDGLRCVCQKGMRLVKDFGGKIQCEPCQENQVTSEDGWSCVTCDQNNPYNPVTNECQPCNDGQISFERTLNGSWYGSPPLHLCQTCALETRPNVQGTRCNRCSQILSVLPDSDNCACPPEQLAGGICFLSPDDVIDDNQQLYKVTFEDLTFDSLYFYDHIRAVQGMCQPKYGNITACQILGNFCVYLLYTRKYEYPSSGVDACSAYLDFTAEERAETEWPENMPWLYYLKDTADRILSETGITTEFTFPDSRIKFKVAMYSLSGTFLGLKDATNGIIQMCKGSESIMNAAYNFGTTYTQTCEISVKEFWDENAYPAVFYDLYLEYTSSSGEEQLYAVPVLITNYLDKDDKAVNQGTDQTKWQLVRRFFLVDNMSGKPVSSSPGTEETESQNIVQPRAVRYAQSMKIHVTLQKGTNNGRIYPPYLEITYGIVKEEDSKTEKKVKCTFDVTYSMDLAKYNDDVEIAVGVLCALGLVYAGAQTWGWFKRSGKIAIDFITLIKFVFFSIGTLANVFFVVIFGASLWWLIFYKRQVSVYLIVPNSDQEGSFMAFVIVAFILKTFHLIHIIATQVSVDIFFMDWERPHGRLIPSNDAQQKGQEAPVSIWRTYFIANEWNEIQTTRKINNLFQIFAVIFFLHVVGFENVVSADPQSSFSRNVDSYYAPYSKIFRFAVAALVYLVIAITQWVFYTFIYERFIEDKIRQYVDLCSLSNISVFILENAQFGYYIHGRSVHGCADTSMKDMLQNLKREEDDLCGQRGLLPNTDNQTFMMTVPRKLRIQYDKVFMPLFTDQIIHGGGGAGQTTGLINPLTEKTIEAYKVLNRFLQAFIDHALRDIDYVIKDKMLIESVLNVECLDPVEKGVFYNDDGHSFDAVLFYGNETTLTMFEILLFNTVDLMSQNFVLSAIVTYVIMEIITQLRDNLGRSNLAKKTLVEKRFLI